MIHSAGKKWAIAAGAVGVVLIACAVEDVRAADFNQSCTKDEDCKIVFEIISTNGKCTQPCAAINKRDEDKYQAATDKELHDCDSVAPGECRGSAICTSGTCSLSGPTAKDASAE